MSRGTKNQQQIVPKIVPNARAKPRRKQRKTPHRGVYILPPDAGHKGYRLRFRDPDTGKLRCENLSAEQGRTAASRRDAAVAKLDKLSERKVALRGGAERLAHVDGRLGEAFELYFASWADRKRLATRGSYRRGVNRFLTWCALPAVGVRNTRQITPSVLAAYRVYLAGLKLPSGEPRAASTVNANLKWLAPVLSELSALGRLPLTPAQIRAALKPLKANRVKRAFYKPSELRAIVTAARDHDADASNTGPFAGRVFGTVLFILLSGLRAKEALAIEWSDVLADEDGHLGIRVRPEVAKTHRERRIDLAHSPLLAHLVSQPNGRTGTILGGTEDALDEARWFLTANYGAPAFTSQALRCSTGTYLTNSPAIFAAASAFKSAQQLGHSITIAERHYVGMVRVAHDARTTEAAMQLGVDLASCPTL